MAFDDIDDLSRRRVYTATAGQTVFTVPFPFFEDEDLVVYVNDVPMTLGSNYSVTGAGDPAGGSITFTTARAVNDAVVIYTDTPIERTAEYSQNGPWTSARTNGEMNRFIVLLQELAAKVSRSIRGSILGDPIAELPATASRANKYLYFNASGAPVLVTGDPSQPITHETLLVYPTEGQTVIPTMAYIPGSGDLSVYMNGVRLIPESDYTESVSSAITLTEDAAEGDVIELVLGEVFDVTLARTAKTSQNITATDGQTTLTTNVSYTPGADEVEVFFNGALLSPGVDYTETNSTTITMTEALEAGDQIRILYGQAYNPADVAAEPFYPVDPIETAAGVTPADTSYPVLDVRRYGAIPGATDSYAGFLAGMTVAASARQDLQVVGGPYRVSDELPFPNYYKVVGSRNARILLDLAPAQWLFRQDTATPVYNWGFVGIKFGLYQTPSATTKDVGLFGLLHGDSYRGALLRDIFIDDVFRVIKVGDNVYGQLTFDNVVGKTSGHAPGATNIAIDLGNGNANAVFMRSIELIGQYGKAIKWKGRTFSIKDWNIAGSSGGSTELDTAIHIVDGKNWSITDGYCEQIKNRAVSYKGQSTGNGSGLSILVECTSYVEDFVGHIDNINMASGSIYIDGDVRKVHLDRVKYAENLGGLRLVGGPNITASVSALKYQDVGSGYVHITDGNSAERGFFPNPTLTGGDFSSAISAATVSDETSDFISGNRAIKVTTAGVLDGRQWALTLPSANLDCTIVAKVKVLTGTGNAVSIATSGNTARIGTGPAGYITTGTDWQIITYSARSTTTTFNFRLRGAVAGTFLIDAIQVYPGICTVDPSTLADPVTNLPSVASASTVTLPAGGGAFNITGTTSITSITAGAAGRVVILKFAGTLTVTDGSNLRLAGNFTTSAEDTMSLVSDGTNWYEITRSAN